MRPAVGGHRARWLVLAIVALVALLAVGSAVLLAGSSKSVTRTARPSVRAVTAAPGVQPPMLVVLGDSTADTMGAALQHTAPQGTVVVEGGLFGCSLATGTWASDRPPVRQLPMFATCNESTPAAQQWPALDARSVAFTRPGDTVLFVGGSWECEDILHAGQWSNITQPSFQRYVLGQLRTLVAIGSAHGARVEIATLPATKNGTLSDSPVRRAIYNRLVRQAAAEDPGHVDVVDLAGILSPGDRFALYLDGVQVRATDGIHTPAYAPGNPFVGNSSEAVADTFDQWLAPRIWPVIISANHPDT